MLFGIKTSKTCSFETVASFKDWPGIQGDHESSVEGNQLGIIALAWAYILSARWIELQETEPDQPNQKKPRRYYLDPQAEWQYYSQGSPDYIDVHLGDVDEEAWRWWAAILANGEGWRIEVDGNRRPYRSPWSIFIESGISQQFRLRGKIRRQHLRVERFTPPSSQKAWGFLADYCILHRLKGQCSVALGAALSISCHKTITFPLPVMRRHYPTASVPPHTNHADIVFEEALLLTYHMTMSAHVKFIHSVSSSVEAWYTSGVPPVLVISHPAWTDIPQSFIFVKAQPVTSRTEIFLEIISRSRECQLLYLADPHRRLIPSMPWKPFGNTGIGDTDLIARKHAKCLGHCLKYQNWSWELNDDTHTVEDPGLQTLLQDQEQQASRDGSEDLGLHSMHRDEPDSSTGLKEDPWLQSYSAEDDTDSTNNCSRWREYALGLKPGKFSKDATRYIFRWMRIAPGWPSAERGIYTHPWISRQRELIEVYQELEVIEPTPADRKGIEDRNKLVEDWLDCIAADWDAVSSISVMACSFPGLTG